MGMSVRAYARHRGVSHTAVQKAIRTARIIVEADGTFDPVAADAQWEANTRPGQGTPPAALEGIDDYATSRALREAYEAKLKKLEYEKASGQLVSREEVTTTVFALARGARDRLLQIPRRLAAQLAAKSDQHEVETVLEQAVREALADLETFYAPDNSAMR